MTWFVIGSSFSYMSSIFPYQAMYLPKQKKNNFKLKSAEYEETIPILKPDYTSINIG